MENQPGTSSSVGNTATPTQNDQGAAGNLEWPRVAGVNRREDLRDLGSLPPAVLDDYLAGSPRNAGNENRHPRSLIGEPLPPRPVRINVNLDEPIYVPDLNRNARIGGQGGGPDQRPIPLMDLPPRPQPSALTRPSELSTYNNQFQDAAPAASADKPQDPAPLARKSSLFSNIAGNLRNSFRRKKIKLSRFQAMLHCLQTLWLNLTRR